MEPIGDVIKHIVKQRNLGDEKALENQALHDPDVQAFLKQNADKIDQKMVKNSISNLYEFYMQKHHPNKVMAGYAPQLFLNGRVIDIRYAPTKAKIAQDRKKAAQRRLQLIDLPPRLHNIDLMEDVDVTDDRNKLLTLIYDFLNKFKKDLHQKGLYLSGEFGVGKTYILAGLANYVVTNMNKNVIFLHVPTFIAGLASHFDDNSPISLQEEIRRISECDLLILDDIGAESLSQWSRDDVLGVILQARMDNVLPTFFSSNLDMEALQSHFEETRNATDPIKARRLMQRVRFLAKEIVVPGPDRRNSLH
ncbi:primosomal protein DnaI [Lactobacillus kitasatonis]|uniref:Primosomal protein DnaI n=1 Tax=Lactobacillus kitasatonis DSM 16761 = JCM 1039 TaxID=1423767 RepID=A0A0R1VIL9_9LACO|nr:primosomal protein DnaI [Lactobacillus kitasatonis]KRM05039.1 primosomal protein DnaI [Lactobacillus kitasatonis DSM 16761 = JCM 1039]